MIEYNDIDFDEIEKIKELWELNRKFHYNLSIEFKQKYESISFSERMNQFKTVAKDGFKITLATKGKDAVGYCISVITDGVGEIESLHVKENERGYGIGKELMKLHTEWLKSERCKKIGVTVMLENKNAIMFYDKYGFKVNTMYMELKDNN